MSNEFRQVDLMIGDVRRRRWTTERKLQIIEESYAPGETVSSAARRHGVAPNEDHYVRLDSRSGSTLLLMPLGQAIAHMDDVEGLQVHRSWWVACHAVQCSIRDGRNFRLRLTTGLEAPVARSKVGMLRSAGWLASQPAIIAQAPDQ